MSLQYLKKELRYEVVVLHADKHESLLQGNIIFNGFGQACPNFLGKCLCDILRKVKSEVRELTAPAGSNTALIIYYTCSVHLSLALFLS